MKEQHPKGLLAKNQHSRGKKLSQILAQLCSDNSIQILLNFTQFITLGTESNLEGFVWSHRRKIGLVSPSQFAPQCQFLASRPFRCFFFSKYPNKSHDFKNLIFMTSSLQNSIQHYFPTVTPDSSIWIGCDQRKSIVYWMILFTSSHHVPPGACLHPQREVKLEPKTGFPKKNKPPSTTTTHLQC